MQLTITGRIIQINPTSKITSTYSKREFLVAEHDISNSNYAIFELLGADVTKADSLKIGAIVTVTFTVQGRKFVSNQGKVSYFNNLIVSVIELSEGTELKVNMPVTGFDKLI